MSKIIFILGAGASAHCGTPLMGNFLEVAEDIWRRGLVKEVDQRFINVFRAIGSLQGIHSKAKLDTYNIETVYAAFEMGKLLKTLPGITDSAEIDELISSLKILMGYTVEKTTMLPTSKGSVSAPVGYNNFAAMIAKLIKQGKSCSLLSFNYDLGLDYALFNNSLPVDYALSYTDNQKIDDKIFDRKKCVPLLKLHGSLNWSRRKCCGKIVSHTLFNKTEPISGHGYSVLPIISELNNLSCCSKPLKEGPFIVPPTWNKTALHNEIGCVWERAANELKDAENIFVLGYSLPSTDFFFNYLFALGVDMKTIIKRFYVFDIDPNVEDRFNNLLGSGIMQRYKYFYSKFDDAVWPGSEGLGLGGLGKTEPGDLQKVISTI